MKDVIRKIALGALKRYANGGESIPDLLLKIDELNQLLEKRSVEHEEHLQQVRKERDHWLMLYDEAKFAVDYMAEAAQIDFPLLKDQTPWETGYIGLPKDPATFYFNPAITQDKDGRILLFARRCRNKREMEGEKPTGYWNEENDIALFELGRDMKARSKNILSLPNHHPKENFEDPRIIRFGDQWGLSVCTFIQGKSYAHQALFLLNKDFNSVGRFDPLFGKNYAQAMVNDGHEKNWLWFVHDGSPHMVYSANPHQVVRFDGRLEVKEIHESREYNPMWKYGEVRGGTNPILVDGLMWTFFHSSLPWMGGKRRYFMGAYAFKPVPPFRMVSMTTMPLLHGTNKQDWWPGLPAVVFPCGSYFDQNTMSFVVSYGINDAACGYVKIPLADLKDLMRTIPPAPDESEIPEEIITLYSDQVIDPPAPAYEGKPTKKYEVVLAAEQASPTNN